MRSFHTRGKHEKIIFGSVWQTLEPWIGNMSGDFSILIEVEGLHGGLVNRSYH